MKDVLFVLRDLVMWGGAIGYLVFMITMAIDKQRPRKLGLEERYVEHKDVLSLLLDTEMGWILLSILSFSVITAFKQLVGVEIPGLIYALVFELPEFLFDIVIMFFRIIVTLFNVTGDSTVGIIIYSFIGFLNSVVPDLVVTALFTGGMVKLAGFIMSKYIWSGDKDLIILFIRTLLILSLFYTIVTGYEAIGVEMNLENTSEIGVVVFAVLIIQISEVYKYFSKRNKNKARV